MDHMALSLTERWCFWKKECKVQIAARRLRRQWSVKFASRVLTNRNIPIVWDNEPLNEIAPPSQTTMVISKNLVIQKKKENYPKVPSQALIEVSPLG